jgi:hypothetical protein
MHTWTQDFEYYLMPARNKVKGFESKYDATYEVWRRAWMKFREEVGVTDHLNSDGFILPHEMGVIFYKGECVGMSAFSHGLLDHGPHQDLAWWNAWDPETIEKLKLISPNAIICSQFTVNPDFAGKGHVVRWKEIVSLMSLLRFLNSDADVMAGQLNLTRGMQNTCGEDNGATVLNPCRPFSFYGTMVDAQLVAYEKARVRVMLEKKELLPLSDDLWSRLINLSELPVTTKIKPALKLVA